MWRMKSDPDGEELGEQREQHELVAEESKKAGDQQRMDVETDSGDHHRAGQEHQGQDCSDREQDQARVQEQPAWTEKEHEAQVAPTVPPGAQVRRPRSSVWAQDDWDFGDLHSLEGRFDHHLARELHSGRAEVQLGVGVFAKASKTAVHVAHGGVKEKPADRGEHWVADPAMGPDHRALLDLTRETVSHDEVMAFAQTIDERPDRAEVVTVVRVAHDHELTAGRVDAADERAAVSLTHDVHHASSQLSGELL